MELGATSSWENLGGRESKKCWSPPPTWPPYLCLKPPYPPMHAMMHAVWLMHVLVETFMLSNIITKSLSFSGFLSMDRGVKLSSGTGNLLLSIGIFYNSILPHWALKLTENKCEYCNMISRFSCHGRGHIWRSRILVWNLGNRFLIFFVMFNIDKFAAYDLNNLTLYNILSHIISLQIFLNTKRRIEEAHPTSALGNQTFLPTVLLVQNNLLTCY